MRKVACTDGLARTTENWRMNMNYTYAAMNKRTGVSLTSTMARTFGDAYDKALNLGLDMNAWTICKA